jgi:hypothetical protein
MGWCPFDTREPSFADAVVPQEKQLGERGRERAMLAKSSTCGSWFFELPGKRISAATSR